MDEGGGRVQFVSPGMRRLRVVVSACTLLSLGISATSPYLADGFRVFAALSAVVVAVLTWWQWRNDRRSAVSGS